MRCNEFWDKWEREPNFCGLSAQSVSEIKGYLELRDKVVKMGVPKATFYENCSSGACRPLLRLSDDETRTKATNYIISSLKRGEKITQGDLQSSIAEWLGKSASCKLPSKNDEKSTQLRTDVKSDPATQPSLAEQMHTGKNSSVHLEPGPVQTPPPSPESAIRQQEMEAAAANQKAATEAPGWTPDTCRKGPCPDGGNHTRLDKIRGLVCQLSNSVCKEMTYCHIIERRKRAEALGFVPGGSAAPAGTSVSAKVVPIRLTREEANDRIRSVVRGYLTESSQRTWEAIRKTGELGETDIEIFQGLLDEAAGRVG